MSFKQLPVNHNAGWPYVRYVLHVDPVGLSRYESTIQTRVPILAVPKLAVHAHGLAWPGLASDMEYHTQRPHGEAWRKLAPDAERILTPR